jgi:hypothetical protein
MMHILSRDFWENVIEERFEHDKAEFTEIAWVIFSNPEFT